MIGIAVYIVGNAVIAYIGNDENIFTADGFVENSLSFTTAETGNFKVSQIAVLNIAEESRIVFKFIIYALTEAYQIFVYIFCQLCSRRQSNNF